MRYLFAAVFAALVSFAQPAAAKDDRMIDAEAPGAPPAGKALVVFMRPSSYGGLVKATVYDVKKDKDVFIGISSAKTQIAYVAEPGDHLFMVVGENADFVDAKLQAGKTYYVLLKVRPGVLKARFSLIPIHKDPGAEYNVASEDFRKWQSKSRWVSRGAGADQWYAEHASDVAKKKADYLRKWNAMREEDRKNLRLHPEDGV